MARRYEVEKVRDGRDGHGIAHYKNGEAIAAAPNQKRRCEITIISFSRSICRGGLAALIGVTGKPYPSCLSCHSHPIRPCGAPSPRGEGCDTRIPSSKKRRRSRHLNPEPNESKVKRDCEEMNPHFFTVPFLFAPVMIVNIPVFLLLQIADAGIDVLEQFFLIFGQCRREADVI